MQDPPLKPHGDVSNGVRDLVPAAMIAVCVTASLFAGQLFPFGQTLLLVRVPGVAAEAGLYAAAAADAAFVDRPAPGYAVLYGDASQVRRALGLAVAWKGLAPCSTTP